VLGSTEGVRRELATSFGQYRERVRGLDWKEAIGRILWIQEIFRRHHQFSLCLRVSGGSRRKQIPEQILGGRTRWRTAAALGECGSGFWALMFLLNVARSRTLLHLIQGFKCLPVSRDGLRK
jgi:hypothetical protein